MSLTLNPEILQRHRGFFSRAPTDRPLVGSWLFPFFVSHQFPSVAASLNPGRIEPEDICVEPFLRDVDRLARAYAEVNDDYPLSIGAFYGVPWMEAIMGCPVHFSGSSLWAEPCLSDWNAYDFQCPDLGNNRWFRKLLELLDGLVKNAEGRFFCAPTLMRGVADLCAAIRGASALPLHVLEFPQHVRRVAEICTEIWIQVAQAQLNRIPDSENGYIVGAGAMRYWAPDRGVWLQDDAIETLSPSLYEDIFLPHVRRIARAFTLAFHLHGRELWPVDILLGVDEIDVLQLSSDNGIDQVLGAWKKTQQRKPCVAFVHDSLRETAAWERILDELSPVGLSLQSFAPTVEDAIGKRDRVYRRGSAQGWSDGKKRRRRT